jgi:hypothetical protein
LEKYVESLLSVLVDGNQAAFDQCHHVATVSMGFDKPAN